MAAETPEEKYNRLRDYIQDLVLRAYPNPNRVNCPGSYVVGEYARRAAAFEDAIEKEEDYQHIMHCSPCYAEFLAIRRQGHAEKLAHRSGKKMSRRIERQLARTLNGLESAIKSSQFKI